MNIFTISYKSMVLPPKDDDTKKIYTLVFAYNVNDGVPNFGNLNSAARTGGGIDSITGVGTTLTDSATNVFTNNGFYTVVGNKTVDGTAGDTARYARVYNATSGELRGADDLWVTQVANDGTNNLLFMTHTNDPFIGEGNTKIFDNATYAHYQLLLFVNNSGTSATQSYEFFLELR